MKLNRNTNVETPYISLAFAKPFVVCCFVLQRNVGNFIRNSVLIQIISLSLCKISNSANLKTLKMKNYHVILTSCVDMVRDVELDNPETKDYRFDLEANSEEEAISIAKEKHHLSVWESDVYEN